MERFELVTSVPTLAPINLNFDELKTQLTEFVEGYKNIIITEEQKGEAKADVATLRKLKTELDDKRKEIKREYMKPCDEFEAKINSLKAIIDEPIAIIDGKLKEFELKRANEKRAKIKAIFDEEMEEYKDNVPYSLIYNPKWENATYSESAIRADIQEIKLGLDRDINILMSMKSEVTDKAITKYYTGGRNLGECIAYINNYEATKAEVLRKQEEEARRKAEEDAKKAQEDASKVNLEQIIEPEVTTPLSCQNEPSMSGGFTNETTGFTNEVKIRLELTIDPGKIYDVLKLLKDNGYKAERI